VTTQVPYRPLPLDQSDVRYIHGPDSTVQEGVPAGTITAFEWNDSTVYPGTSRKFWVYVPAQYAPMGPASLMVFQDGHYYLHPEGEVRGAIVLDNLIHRGDIPVTIGVFVDPGVFEDVEVPDDRKNRNAEYDAFDDRYVKFLLDEIIPEVTKRWSISEDPDRWGICGGSSGGNCAFTRQQPTCRGCARRGGVRLPARPRRRRAQPQPRRRPAARSPALGVPTDRCRARGRVR
jgi:hypothetical protein